MFEKQELRYEDLNNKANQLAHLLIDRGVTPGAIVGFMLEKSIDVVVTILAIVKTGCIYLPIDVEHPAERINYMLEDSDSDFLITTDRFLGKVEYNKNIILLGCSDMIRKNNQS